jgi:hypothetical protein
MRRTDTPQKKAAFLDALRERYSIYHAAKTVGVGRRTIYRWRDADPDFEAAMEDAKGDAVDALESSLYERAIKSDTVAAIFLLKGALPDKYRERREISGPSGGPLLIVTGPRGANTSRPSEA